MSNKRKPHPLDSLTFAAPKLEEVQPATAVEVAARAAVKTAAPAVEAVAEVETRASNVILPVAVWDWIDAKHAEARRGGGKAIRKAAVIRAVFELAMGLEFDLTGAQSEGDILARMMGAAKLDR